VTVDVYAADEQHDHVVALNQWIELARSVLVARGIKGEAEVSLLFVDKVAIAGLNEQFLGHEGPTDVLSFPIEDDPTPSGRSPDFGGTGPGSSEPSAEPLTLLGDVVICPAVAAVNAVEHGVTLDDEMALLVVHGLLHLLGMDHEDEAEAEQMEKLEIKLLRRFHTPTTPSGRSDTNRTESDTTTEGERTPVTALAVEGAPSPTEATDPASE
jgi:probable rRNA maturation factor